MTELHEIEPFGAAFHDNEGKPHNVRMALALKAVAERAPIDFLPGEYMPNASPVTGTSGVWYTFGSGFAVDEGSLEGTGLIANQFNVNDGTVEGMRHKDLPIYTAQYHPEASPGPWDTTFLFDKFGKVIREGRL